MRKPDDRCWAKSVSWIAAWSDRARLSSLLVFPAHSELSSEHWVTVIHVQFMGEEKNSFPDEVQYVVRTAMKGTAEASLGTKVDTAVVPVPADFNDSQREFVFTVSGGCLAPAWFHRWYAFWR